MSISLLSAGEPDHRHRFDENQATGWRILKERILNPVGSSNLSTIKEQEQAHQSPPRSTGSPGCCCLKTIPRQPAAAPAIAARSAPTLLLTTTTLHGYHHDVSLTNGPETQSKHVPRASRVFPRDSLKGKLNARLYSSDLSA
jgi:hypothetical protein